MNKQYEKIRKTSSKPSTTNRKDDPWRKYETLLN